VSDLSKLKNILVAVWHHFGSGAGVPSDHFPTGTMNKLNGSGGPFCKSETGEFGKSAPQFAPSMIGV
jgi:hypothetical protein